MATKETTIQLVNHAGRLLSARDAVVAKIEAYNAMLARMAIEISEATEAYNLAVVGANDFRSEATDEMHETFESHSEEWQNGDIGTVLESRMEIWDEEFTEMDEIELPEPIQIPDFDAITQIDKLG